MRLSITHTKNNTYFYMIKSYRETEKIKPKLLNVWVNLKKLNKKQMVKIQCMGEKIYRKNETKKKNKIKEFTLKNLLKASL